MDIVIKPIKCKGKQGDCTNTMSVMYATFTRGYCIECAIKPGGLTLDQRSEIKAKLRNNYKVFY